MAALAAPLLSQFLLGVSPIDPVTYGLVAATFGGVALVASYLPAHRASRIDPVESLRLE